MAYYNVCPYCKASLDPGERCDCQSQEERRKEFMERIMKENPATGQYEFRMDGTISADLPGHTG